MVQPFYARELDQILIVEDSGPPYAIVASFALRKEQIAWLKETLQGNQPDAQLPFTNENEWPIWFKAKGTGAATQNFRVYHVEGFTKLWLPGDTNFDPTNTNTFSPARLMSTPGTVFPITMPGDPAQFKVTFDGDPEGSAVIVDINLGNPEDNQIENIVRTLMTTAFGFTAKGNAYIIGVGDNRRIVVESKDLTGGSVKVWHNGTNDVSALLGFDTDNDEVDSKEPTLLFKFQEYISNLVA